MRAAEVTPGLRVGDLCCSPVLQAELRPAEAVVLAAALKVLADPARLRLLGLIRSAVGGRATTGALADRVGLTQPTVTHHLGALLGAGFLERERDGRQTWYWVNPEGLEAVRQLLDPSPPSPAVLQVNPRERKEMSDRDLVEQVRLRYGAAARAAMGTGHRALDLLEEPGGSGGCCSGSGAGEVFGSVLYDAGTAEGAPAQAVTASLGCGNPIAVAALHPGERVLDLGSGGGLDVLLSARRVGPDGFAYGVDMTDEMLELARQNAARAGATNVEFLKGRIEQVPLPDAAVDVVISNCVINLSVDKGQVLAEMFRVLAPGGRVGLSDVVAEDRLTPADRAERGSHVGCVAGALSRSEYLDGLAAAGFTEAEVEFTHEVAPQMHAAVVRATKPAS